MESLRDDERMALRAGFQGPRPANNVWPLLQLQKDGVVLTGERIEELFRHGIIIAEPRKQVSNTIPGGNAGPFGEIPDIDLSFNYYLAK